MSHWRRALSIITISLLSVWSLAAPVAAQEQAGSGLIISPTRSELEIMPGGTGEVEITLSNVSGGSITAEATVNDFVSEDNTGKPKILTNSDEKLPVSIQDFITNLDDIKLSKDEKKTFKLNIAVPEDTSAGAYYGVVRYTAIPEGRELTDQERQIALSASVGSLVLITVPGDITEQVQLREVRVGFDGTFGTFLVKKPNVAEVEIKNLGNGFSKPFGRVTLTNFSGDEVYSYELNNASPRANILPDTTRVFSNPLEGVSAPGRYTLTANISHGNGGEVLTQKVSFWYIPVWLLIVGLLILLAIAAGVYVLYRNRFKRSRRR